VSRVADTPRRRWQGRRGSWQRGVPDHLDRLDACQR